MVKRRKMGTTGGNQKSELQRETPRPSGTEREILYANLSLQSLPDDLYLRVPSQRNVLELPAICVFSDIAVRHGLSVQYARFGPGWPHWACAPSFFAAAAFAARASRAFRTRSPVPGVIC